MSSDPILARAPRVDFLLLEPGLESTGDNIRLTGREAVDIDSAEEAQRCKRETMRDQAPSGLEIIPTLNWGAHLCQAFEHERDLTHVLVPYFKAGLENNEACLWVTADPFPASAARAALRAVLPDLDVREATKQIEIRDASDWYKPGDTLDPDGFIADLERREKDAVARGYEGLRTHGNCSWVKPEQRADFQTYEDRVHRMVAGRRIICMCSYGPHQTRGPAFHRVMRCHHMLISPLDPAEGPTTQPASPDHSAALPRPATLDEVLITEQLEGRASARPNYLREKLAIEDLARHMAELPSGMLPQLVDLALDLCGADSAGVSVLEGQEFRWLGLRGALSAFEAATTPRNFSPCGVCLDRDNVVLMEHPERLYSWIADVNITVPEVLLVPLRAHGREQIGTLWVVAREKGQFNSEHARVLAELASFTGVALHMIKTEQRLTQALEHERLIAGEMSHRVKNMYAVAASIVRMSAQRAASTREMAVSVTARLSALSEAHSLARKAQTAGVDLCDLLQTILRAYQNFDISGPPVFLSEQALGSMAMVFHELATNALKYGALRYPEGRIIISWACKSGMLSLNWREVGGSVGQAPETNGFGSALIRSSVATLGGTIEKTWAHDGLDANLEIPLERLSGPSH